MNWFWIALGAMGGLFYLFTRGRRTVTHPSSRWAAASKKTVSTEDRVDTALASGDAAIMASTLNDVGEPVLRDMLLSAVVAEHYREREDPSHREKFYEYAAQHIDEAAGILDAVEALEGERPWRIDAFKMMAIALVEEQRFDEAIDVCRRAMTLGLEDGTKTGFRGRIARIEKKRGT